MKEIPIVFHFESSQEDVEKRILEHVAKWIAEGISKYPIEKQDEIYTYIKNKLVQGEGVNI